MKMIKKYKNCSLLTPGPQPEDDITATISPNQPKHDAEVARTEKARQQTINQYTNHINALNDQQIKPGLIARLKQKVSKPSTDAMPPSYVTIANKYATKYNPEKSTDPAISTTTKEPSLTQKITAKIGQVYDYIVTKASQRKALNTAKTAIKTYNNAVTSMTDQEKLKAQQTFIDRHQQLLDSNKIKFNPHNSYHRNYTNAYTSLNLEAEAEKEKSAQQPTAEEKSLADEQVAKAAKDAEDKVNEAQRLADKEQATQLAKAEQARKEAEQAKATEAKRIADAEAKAKRLADHSKKIAETMTSSLVQAGNKAVLDKKTAEQAALMKAAYKNLNTQSVKQRHQIAQEAATKQTEEKLKTFNLAASITSKIKNLENEYVSLTTSDEVEQFIQKLTDETKTLNTLIDQYKKDAPQAKPSETITTAPKTLSYLMIGAHDKLITLNLDEAKKLTDHNAPAEAIKNKLTNIIQLQTRSQNTTFQTSYLPTTIDKKLQLQIDALQIKYVNAEKQNIVKSKEISDPDKITRLEAIKNELGELKTATAQSVQAKIDITTEMATINKNIFETSLKEIKKQSNLQQRIDQLNDLQNKSITALEEIKTTQLAELTELLNIQYPKEAQAAQKNESDGKESAQIQNKINTEKQAIVNKIQKFTGPANTELTTSITTQINAKIKDIDSAKPLNETIEAIESVRTTFQGMSNEKEKTILNKAIDDKITSIIQYKATIAKGFSDIADVQESLTELEGIKTLINNNENLQKTVNDSITSIINDRTQKLTYQKPTPAYLQSAFQELQELASTKLSDTTELTTLINKAFVTNINNAIQNLSKEPIQQGNALENLSKIVIANTGTNFELQKKLTAIITEAKSQNISHIVDIGTTTPQADIFNMPKSNSQLNHRSPVKHVGQLLLNRREEPQITNL